VTAAFLLAGLFLLNEPLVFEGTTPQFTREQTRRTTPATRDGLRRWAATSQGRRLLSRFSQPDYRIVIVEDGAESGMGRAPQPAMGTMLSAGDRKRLKVYQLILNPAFADMPDVGTRIFREPGSAAEMMSVAWAGEMLHIYFYSQGIVLPHHERADFQKEWQAVAEQLGFPNLPHDDTRRGSE
jgi:hypothetical protein